MREKKKGRGVKERREGERGTLGFFGWAELKMRGETTHLKQTIIFIIVGGG